MNMKSHILAAMKEQLGQWQTLLLQVHEEKITESNFDDDWSIQDVINHLWGWQQITLARMEAAAQGREPVFPAWINEMGSIWHENADQTNAQIYKKFHTQPWSQTYENWQQGYLHLLEISEKITEKNLLDGDWYSWLNGHSPSAYLISSYDHHQEHLEKLSAWLKNQGN